MDIENRILQIEQELKSLKDSSSIPNENYEAIKGRLLLETIAASTSTKATSTESQTVNEGGLATYSVAKVMDGFIKLRVGGTDYNIPYYN